jgi:hypothetical protein
MRTPSLVPRRGLPYIRDFLQQLLVTPPSCNLDRDFFQIGRLLFRRGGDLLASGT